MCVSHTTTALTHATLLRCCGGESKWLRSEGFRFLPASFPKAVCAGNGCRETEEQLGGAAQPGDGGHDSSAQQRGECTMFLSACLRGVDDHRGATTC